MLPGAIATAISMAVVGRLTNKFDPRMLITIGALIFALAAWQLSRITGESGAQRFLLAAHLPRCRPGPDVRAAHDGHARRAVARRAARRAPACTTSSASSAARSASPASRRCSAATRRRFASVIGDHLAARRSRRRWRASNMLTHGMMARGADPWTAHQRALALLDRQLVAQAERAVVQQDLRAERRAHSFLIPLLLLVRQTKGAGGSHAIME